MQRWEYKIESLGFFNMFKESKEEGLKEAKSMSQQKECIERKLNECGKGGWELIDIKITEGVPERTQLHFNENHTPTRGDTYYCYFKRPLNV